MLERRIETTLCRRKAGLEALTCWLSVNRGIEEEIPYTRILQLIPSRTPAVHSQVTYIMFLVVIFCGSRFSLIWWSGDGETTLSTVHTPPHSMINQMPAALGATQI